MKSSTFLLVCFLLGIQGGVINNPEDDLRRVKACQEQSNVNAASLKNIPLGRFDNDPNLKEYLLCVSKMSGYQNEAGYLQSDVIRVKLKAGHYNDDTIEEMVQDCTQQKETPQETAFQFMKCIYDSTFQKKYT